MNELVTAIEYLREKGRQVERSEFPPAPLPPLWLVDGRELTSMQIIDLASQEARSR